MKRTIPVLITMLAGIVLLISNFIPATVSWGEAATIWFDILAGIAFLLGGANLVRVHLKKVSDKHSGWGYSLIVLGTFFLTLGIGLCKVGVKPASNSEFYGETFAHVRADNLPPELIYKVPGVFPERLKGMTPEELYYAIPASCRDQFVISSTGEFSFKGWMLGTQQGDLLSLSELIDWKAAIEDLYEKAQPPAELQGAVLYRFEHHAVAINGVLTNAQEEMLLNLGSTESWKTAIKTALSLTHQAGEYKLKNPVENFFVPEPLASRLQLTSDKTLKVTGPLAEDDYKLLAKQFPVVRSISTNELERIEQELNRLKPLSPKQTELLRNKLKSYDWSTAQLIETINSLGKPVAGTKTYRQIKAERDQGITEFDMNIPASGEPNLLNAAQQEILRQYAQDATMRIETLLTQLKSAGSLATAQEAELKRFLGQLPTTGKRNREVCMALYGMAGESISQTQIVYLMSEYKRELSWASDMHRVFLATNPVKFSWSGQFDDADSPYGLIYEYMFSPLQSTVFALLAFYVASAAFRAFRAKNMEAILLLGTAFIILLGRTYAGGLLSEMVPEQIFFLKIHTITDWIMQVPYTAGGRAVMIGIALGVISTSLKVLLGIDRSFLGGDD